MESNGKSGYIMISEATKRLIEVKYINQFIYEEPKIVKILEKEIMGYIIRPAFIVDHNLYIWNNNFF